MEKKGTLAKHLCLCAAAALLALPHIQAHAEDILIEHGWCGQFADYYGYDTDGDGAADKLVISGRGSTWNLPVRNLWQGSNGALDARTVIIKEGVTDIGADKRTGLRSYGTFRGLSNLTSITIPDSVTMICSHAFEDCDNLTDITIPDSVTEIGREAFWGCDRLTNITLPNALTTVEEETFKNCPSLKTVTIPYSVTAIGECAFDSTGLTEVTLPGSVASIGNEAFHDCPDLRSVTVLNSSADIGDLAFGYMRNPESFGSVYQLDGFTVYGYADSTAQRYARENNENGSTLPFVALESNWQIVDGIPFWFEDGVKQGVRYNEDGTIDLSYRGKEIFDPSTNAWYWLDSVLDGRVAKSKDVYQESAAGEWAESADGTGKWVRYDKDGHMVKGWDENYAGKFYFDPQYGTMAKGYATIGNMEYYFNMQTGVLESGRVVPEYGFAEVDGRTVFFDDYRRQGYSAHNAEYQGKEVQYSGSWYWLDNANQGEMVRAKDICHPADGVESGKLVRYDSEGQMMKGWVAGTGEDAVRIYEVFLDGTYVDPLTQADGRDLYFFDWTTGAMIKGDFVRHGVTYHFDETTGILDMP